jgi:hypothetical protein
VTERRLLVWNGDFEEELERRSPVERKPDATRERIERRLAARFLFVGSGKDTLLAPWPLPEAFREAWRARGVELPAVASEPPREPHRLVAWGAAPSLTRLGEVPPLEAVRRANSKVFAHELARKLGLAPPGWVCASEADVTARLAERFAPGELWVVKRAFGFAGRGHLLGRGPELPPNGAGWLRRAFAGGDAVVLEPWVARERDLSVQLEVGRDGAVRIVGQLELLTNENGSYLGHKLGALELAPEHRARLAAAGEAVGRELAREGYFGPAGIDAYVERGGELRPLVEVNARHTLGRVALAFERLVPEGGVACWRGVRDGRRAAAVGWLTDPWPEEPGESSVLLVAPDAAELARLEASLSAASW